MNGSYILSWDRAAQEIKVIIDGVQIIRRRTRAVPRYVSRPVPVIRAKVQAPVYDPPPAVTVLALTTFVVLPTWYETTKIPIGECITRTSLR